MEEKLDQIKFNEQFSEKYTSISTEKMYTKGYQNVCRLVRWYLYIKLLYGK